MNDIAVSNSACLIALERVSRLDILAQSFDTIFIPTAVHRELGYSIDWLIEKIGLLKSQLTIKHWLKLYRCKLMMVKQRL